MTDAQLIRAIQAGDATALPLLYERGVPVVWRYVYRRLHGDLHATEDVVSETFLAAIRAVDRMHPDGGSLCGWLLGIARNKLGRHRERVGRRGCLLERLAALPEACPSAGGCDPADRLAAAEETAEIIRVLDELSDDQRLVLEWMYLDGLPRREIAERLGRTVKAVENILYRARQSFRTLYRHRAATSRRY